MTNVLGATSMKQAQPRHMRNIHTIMWLSFLQKLLIIKFGLRNFSVIFKEYSGYEEDGNCK